MRAAWLLLVAFSAAAAQSRTSAQNVSPTLGNLSGIGLEVGTLGRLRATLLKGYDKERVPQASLVRPINVSLYMWPYDILYIKEAQGSIKISGWLDMYWTDHFLTWDPAEWGGISTIPLGADHIWLPGIDIFYTKEDVIKSESCGPNCYVRVDHTGSVLRGIYFSYAFPCSFNVKYFPFDRQHCDLEVANWYLDQSIMDLWPKGDTVDMSVFLPNEEWDLENITVVRKSVFYNYGYFPSIVYKIVISRKPFYYVCNLVFPSVIITGAAVIGYHMPSTGTGIHQEKVKMGLTAILSIFILQLGIADKMPRTSDVIPLINIFYFCLVAILSLAILVTSLIILVEKQYLKGAPVPAHWRRLFGLGEPAIMPGQPPPTYSYSSLVRPSQDGRSSPRPLQHAAATREESREPDTESESLSNHLLDSVYFSPKRGPSPLGKAGKGEPLLSVTEEKTPPPEPTAIVDLRRNLQEILGSVRRKAAHDRTRYEWSLLADCLERLSMFAFILAIAASCLLFAFHDWY